MAEGGKEPAASENSWENWFGGWMQTAKEKSNSALEFMKKDLSEFTTTMQYETEKVMEMTNSTLKGDKLSENTATATNKVKAGLTSFLDNISKALVIPPEDDAGVPMKVSADGTSLYDRGKARLHTLQLDAGTYMDPPRGPPEQYIMWVESFDMDQHKGEISELLVSKVEIRALYTKLVPNEVSHAEFWQRYFYRVHQLDCDEARKQALMKRADDVKGEPIRWDDDDWSGGEEDDGNQSDWEKMPRPNRTAEDKSTLQTKEPSPQPQSAPSESVKLENTVSSSSQSQQEPSPEPILNPVQLEDSRESQQERSPDPVLNPVQLEESRESQQEPSPEPVLNPVQLEDSKENQREPSPETVLNPVQLEDSRESSIAPLPSITNNDLPKSFSPEPEQGPPYTQNEQNFADVCAAAEDPSENEEQRMSQVQTETSAELWSLHIPEDTASGAPDGNQDADSVEPGSSSDVAVATPPRNLPTDRQSRPEDSGACAAAAGDGEARTSVSSKPDVSVADGACGASDLVVSTSVPSVNVPETVDTEAPASSEDVPVEQASNQTVASPPVSESTNEKPKDSVPNTVPEGPGEESKSQEMASPQLDVPVVQSDQDVAEQINVRVKGDMVVVGDRDSPSSDSSDNKERKKKLGEDWEDDFDIEVTEEDLKAAEDIAKKLGENLDDEDGDWENWE